MPKPDVPDHDPYLAADGSGVLENLLGLNKPDVLRETEFRRLLYRPSSKRCLHHEHVRLTNLSGSVTLR